MNYFNSTAELGYWLAKDFWGQGLMPEAAKKIIEFAFNDLGLSRVEAYAATENIASNTVLKKVGFTFEGTKRKAMKSKATGVVHDANMYGLLKEDFK